MGLGRDGTWSRPRRNHRRAWGLALLCLAALINATPVAAETLGAKPLRIVSINVCVDQLLLLLAPRERIVSLSFLVREPAISALTEAAAGLPINYGLAEEILPLEPDLVVTSAYSTRPTVAILRKLGVPVLQLPIASDMAGIRRNVRQVAKALGEIERGEALLADFDRRLAAAAPPPQEPRPLAVLYGANGYTAGHDTLPAAAMAAAGYRVLATELGLQGTARLPLEQLLTADPAVLVVDHSERGPALAQVALQHPALRRAFASRALLRVPARLWACGTPLVVEAVELLAAFRAKNRPRQAAVRP